MNQVFGKNVSFPFSVLKDGEALPLYELVGARVYSGSPTQTQIDDVGDTLSQSELTEATSWSVGADNVYTLDFGASLADPDAHDGSDYETYYLVVNFRFEEAGSVKFVVKPFRAYKPSGLLSQIAVTASDVAKLEADLETLKGTLWVEDKISRAISDVLRKIKQLGLDRNRVDQDDLRDAIIYRTVSLAYIDLAGENNQFYFEKANFWNTEFAEVWKETDIGYDLNDDGVVAPEEKEPAGSPGWIIS